MLGRRAAAQFMASQSLYSQSVIESNPKRFSASGEFLGVCVVVVVLRVSSDHHHQEVGQEGKSYVLHLRRAKWSMMVMVISAHTPCMHSPDGHSLE